MDDTVTYKTLVDKGGFRQRIVICGSMSFYAQMLRIQKALLAKGIPAIIPEAEDEYVSSLSPEEFGAFKRQVSFQYLKKIRAPETVAVLALNRNKHGIANYVGPNTFAEIAVAFAQGKKIFLFQDMPTDYCDELSAWGAIELHGRLDGLLRFYRAAAASSRRQLTLFGDL